MVQLAVWVLACLTMAWLLQSRPIWGAGLTILLWTAVPAIAGHHLTGLSGGALAFHPATWLVLSIFVVQLVLNPSVIGAALGRHALLLLVVFTFSAVALLTSRLMGSGGTRLLMDQIVGPMILFWLVVAFAYRSGRWMLFLRNVILFAAAGESILAVVQSILGRIVFYESDYLKLYWFDPEKFERWMGTTDSPLVLSLALCVSAALALSVRNWALRFSLLTLFLVGALIVQSRTGTAVMCAIILYSILRAHMVLWARALTCLAVVIVGYYLASSTIIAGLAGRLANDTGSADARLRAVWFVYDNWVDYLATGQGLTSSYGIARDAGLQTSIESSFLMYVVDVGFILALAYFGAQFAMLIRYGWQRGLLGGTLAALIGCGLQHTFSGVAGTNLSGTYIWAALALMVVAWTAAPPVPGTSSAARRGVLATGRPYRRRSPAKAAPGSVGADLEGAPEVRSAP